jgi:ParB family chromosome partitioning protein
MSRKHGAVYDDLGGDLGEGAAARAERGGTRFLKRSNALGDRISGAVEEKTLLWVDPEDCVMWERHNRAYDLLTEEGCRDLIDAIRAQGRQEFPAVVRRPAAGGPFQVICGARRHFAVSWLRRHGYTQFRYLIEVRDLTDEEAFRLADVENRNRTDISDYERACDYAAAIDAYYGGSQKAMAERLEVSQAWLSRYLALARLPKDVVGAFASVTDLRESHARQLMPLMRTNQGRTNLLAEARKLKATQVEARDRGTPPLDAGRVIARLKATAAAPTAKPAKATIHRRDAGEAGLRAVRQGRTWRLELRADASRADAEAWFEMFLDAEWGAG